MDYNYLVDIRHRIAMQKTTECSQKQQIPLSLRIQTNIATSQPLSNVSTITKATTEKDSEDTKPSTIRQTAESTEQDKLNTNKNITDSDLIQTQSISTPTLSSLNQQTVLEPDDVEDSEGNKNSICGNNIMIVFSCFEYEWN
jgi:hypothetical protein